MRIREASASERLLRCRNEWMMSELGGLLISRISPRGACLLLGRHISSYVNRVTSDDRGDDESLMKKVENLKSKKFGIPNYSRFFDPIDDFNTEFCRQVSSQKFLKSRNKGQIEVQMGCYSSRLVPKKLI